MEAPLRDRFFQRGRDFLGVDTPIMCGAMTWVSDPKLVAAVSNAGGMGCLAAANMPVDELERQIAQTRELTTKPFAVNLITIAPAYESHLDLIRRMQLPFVIFAGSFPRSPEIEIAKESGAKVMCFASTESIARRMVRYGADGIILEGMEAGGHVGHVALSVLVQQVLFELPDVPVICAGGIGRGRFCAHLLLMGATGVQLGTRFAVSTESCAHPKFKERFLSANARDAVSTPQFDSRLPVVAVRALRNKGQERFANLQLGLINQIDQGALVRQEAQDKVEEFWVGALRRAVLEGDVEAGSLMAGQSVGLVNKIMPIQAIVDELVTDIEAELQRVQGLMNQPDSVS